MTTEIRLPTGLKASWGVGAFGAAVLMNSMSVLLIYYLSSVVGISIAIAGILLSVARLFDAFTDPIVGYVSDRWTGRSGRRRPFLLVGAFVSALSVVLIYNIPFRGDEPTTIAYVFVLLLLYGTGYTLFNVPYMAMPAEMTDGYHERSSIHAWRVVFAAIGLATAGSGAGLLLGALADPASEAGRQVNSPADYTVVSLVFGSLVLVGMLACWWGTRSARMVARSEKKLPTKEGFKLLAANKPFQIIIGVKAAQLLALYANQAALLFMLVNVMERSSASLALVQVPKMIVGILVTPLLVRFARSFGKRAGYFLAATFIGVSYLSWVFASPAESDWVIAIRGIMLGVGFSGNVMFAMSMLTDCMEMDAIESGVQRQGVFTAIYSFVEKISGALGPAVVGIALGMVGFDPSVAITADSYQEVRHATLIGIAYIPGAMAGIAALLLMFYRLDQQKLRNMRSATSNT